MAFNSNLLPLPNGKRLLLCSMPRVKDDFDEILKTTSHLISLVEEKVSDERLTVYHLPTQDYTPPSFKDWQKLKTQLPKNQDLAIHCHAGLGRTGTLAAMILIDQGLKAQEAIDYVRHYRKAAIETSAQESFLMNYSLL
jgi:protein-tyrosine phosphatase